MRTRFRRERRNLRAGKRPTTPCTNGGSRPEFGAVTIDFKPGPDSRDRLRRLFTILLEHAATGGQATTGEGGGDCALSDNSAGEE